MKDLKSLRMQGDLTTSGQKIGVDMQITTSGDCQGTITVADGSAQLVSSGGQAYMKPDKAFWESQAPGQAAQIEAVVGDKWVVIPSASGLDSACDLNQLLDGISKPSADPSNAPSTASSDSVDGQDAVKLTSKDSSGKPVTAWVATDDPALRPADAGDPGRPARHHHLQRLRQVGDDPGAAVRPDDRPEQARRLSVLGLQVSAPLRRIEG